MSLYICADEMFLEIIPTLSHIRCGLASRTLNLEVQMKVLKAVEEQLGTFPRAVIGRTAICCTH